ncbi:MAG: hypothetical protein NVSMB10_16560 [Steroidobacteraceae bacterium]
MKVKGPRGGPEGSRSKGLFNTSSHFTTVDQPRPWGATPIEGLQASLDYNQITRQARTTGAKMPAPGDKTKER